MLGSESWHNCYVGCDRVWNMLSKDQARALVANRLRDDVVIVDDCTIEKDWGWVFFYNTRRFVETKNFRDGLIGNGPYMVNRFDGSVSKTDTAYPIEPYIQRYERQLTGEAPHITENLSAWLDHVRFDTTRYVFKGEASRSADDRHRCWLTPAGDAVDLHLITLPPSLPAHAHSRAQIEEFYRRRLAQMEMLEFRMMTLDGIDCIWMLSKSSFECDGETYVGWLDFPFADFNYHFMIASTHPRDKPRSERPSDDEQYDVQFPNHPVSRVRREFAHIRLSFRVDNTVKDQKRYDLPTGVV